MPRFADYVNSVIENVRESTTKTDEALQQINDRPTEAQGWNRVNEITRRGEQSSSYNEQQPQQQSQQQGYGGTSGYGQEYLMSAQPAQQQQQQQHQQPRQQARTDWSALAQSMGSAQQQQQQESTRPSASVGRVPVPSVPTSPSAQDAQQDQKASWTNGVDFLSFSASSEHVPPVDEFDMEMRRSEDDVESTSREVKKAKRATRKAIRDARQRRRNVYTAQSNETEVADRNENIAYVDPIREIRGKVLSELPSNNRVYKEPIDATKKQVKARRSKSDVGARIWGKILSDERLRFNEIGIGLGELTAVLEQNRAYFDEMVVGLFPDGTEGYDVATIADMINSAANRRDGTEVHIGVNKPPDTDISDQQDMVLRIMTDHPRGIFMNGLISNLFTADFDGDDTNVSLDPLMPQALRETMDLMISPDGTTHINPAWFTTEHIIGGFLGYEGAEGREMFVRDVMLAGIDVNAAIVQRVLALADNDNEKDKGLLLKDLMLQIRKYVGDDNARFEEILHSIYTSFQRLKRYVIADTIGTYVDSPVEPRTEDDRMLLRFVDDVVVGKIPNNWFDFCDAFNSFIGDVKGQNSNFRVSGSVGKKYKLDTRIRIGDDYLIDLGDGRQVETFLQATFEYAMAERMSHEFKRNGRSYAYAQEVKRNVILKVGYPDSKDKDERPIYPNTIDWLLNFIRVYQRESALVNEANLVIRSNLQISQASNRSVVATIDPSISRGGKLLVGYADVADALVQVYEDATIEALFKNLGWKVSDPRGWDREMWRDNYTPEGSTRATKGIVAKTKYRSYSLRRFSKDNHMVTNGADMKEMKRCAIPVWDETRGMWRVETYDSEKGQVVTKYYQRTSSNLIESNLLLAIADQKTSSESTYASRVYGYVEPKTGNVRPEFKHSKRWQSDYQRRNEQTNKYYDESGRHKTLMQMRLELLRDIAKAKDRGGHDTYLAISDIIRLVTASGPELFAYFDLDNVKGWEESGYAKAMMDAATSNEGDALDTLGGINMSMHYIMRTDEMFADMERIKLYHDTPGMSELEGQTMNKVALMQQELASSSQTWQAIMMEYKLATGYQELPELAKALQREAEENEGNKDYRPSRYLEAGWYWLLPPDQRHQSVDELMRDVNLGFVAKRNILCDLVRFHTGDSLFRSYEVCMQLESGSKGVWKLDQSGGQQVFETYNNLERLFNQYGDVSYENMVSNIEDAYEEYGESSGALMGTIHTLATHPGMMCRMAFETMADGVCSVMERTYDQTEKSKDHPWANEAYQGLSISRHGGYYNELYRTDDLVCGVQHIKQISARDLVMLLDDPSFVLTGYNDFGQVIRVNRDQLLGFQRGERYDVEQEVWRFLRENPRIAGCLRMQEVAVSASMDAKAYAVAACDTKETIARCHGKNGEAAHNPIDDVAYLMFDHPVFHGIASLVTPAYGTKASHRSPMVAETERYLCWVIYKNAVHGKDHRKARKNAEGILRMIGITRKTLSDAMKSDFSADLERAGIRDSITDATTKEREAIAEQIYGDCLTYMTNYLIEVGNDPSVDRKQSSVSITQPSWLGPDRSSLHSFYDVIQELSGSKTQVSTGIEGYETFQYGNWAQLIGKVDRYTTLDLILDELENDPELAQTFDGAWTNAMNSDGSVMTLSVENGVVTNLEALRDALSNGRDSAHDDLIVLCPATYEVKDRTIDSKGRNIPTQRSYMMEKRALGAEEHNLQVMKTGIDGTDSITKIKSKYFDVGRDRYQELVNEMQEAAASGSTDEERLFLARLCLAKELLRANTEINYTSHTLSNYMCMADLMVVMGDDQEIYLRSFAQILTALKYRLGVHGRSMSSDQLRTEADKIINDVSDVACIGRAVGNVSEAFDYLTPSRVSPSARGVYPYLSNQSVNKRVLDQIADTTGHYPWSASDRERVESDLKRRHRWLKDVLKSTFILRQYHVASCVDSRRWDEFKESDVGMSSLAVIGEDLFTGDRPISRDELRDFCYRAAQHGNTILVPAVAIDNNVLSPLYAGDAMPVATDKDGNPSWYIVNTFHQRLNGVEARPYQATFAMAQVPYDKDVYAVEDSFGEFEYGDSIGKITGGFRDRCGISNQPKSIQVSIQSLFAQQYDMLDRNGYIEASLVDQTTLDDYLDGKVEFEIDYGVPVGSKDYERRKRDVDAAIGRYMGKTDNGDGLILGQDCAAGDIVAWAIAKVHNDGKVPKYVLAPIIPLPLHGVKRGMERFQCISIDYDHGSFNVDIVNSAPFDGYAKAFLPSGGADKVMVDLSSPIDDAPRTLRDGTQLDIYVDSRTTSSRRVGTLNRLRTMETLIRVARRNGYNFANLPNAFPDAAGNPAIAQLKEGLRFYPPPPAEFWSQVIDTVRFHTDPKIDAFVRFNCRKILRNGGNPSHFLASEFIDPNIDPENPINSMMQWEYIPSFENGLDYEDAFLRFFHELHPSGQFDGPFCPNGIDDNRTDCLFRLMQNDDGVLADGFNRGVLQMQVPHKFLDYDSENHRFRTERWVYTWECVFAGLGFFGEDFSSGSRPNVEGSSRMADVLNTIGYSGNVDISKEESRLKYAWMTSDLGGLPMTGNVVSLWK